MHRIPIVVTFPSSCYTFVVLQTFQKNYNIWGQFIRAWFDVLKLCHLQKLMHQCPISLMQAWCHLFLSILVGTWSVQLTWVFCGIVNALGKYYVTHSTLRHGEQFIHRVESHDAGFITMEILWKRCTLLSIFKFLFHFNVLIIWWVFLKK
jgi:hypothetical protein